MKTKTIKVDIPDGFKVVAFNMTTMEVTVQEKSKLIMDRIRTVQDILSYHDIALQEFDWQCMANHLSRDEVAYRLLKMLALALNEGWTPNWSDRTQRKYAARFEMAEGEFQLHVDAHWFSLSSASSRLCFKSEQLATYAGTQFAELYKQFML